MVWAHLFVKVWNLKRLVSVVELQFIVIGVEATFWPNINVA